MLTKPKLKHQCCHCCNTCFRADQVQSFSCEICLRLGKKICTFHHSSSLNPQSQSIQKINKSHSRSIKNQIVSPHYRSTGKMINLRPASYSPLRHPVKYSVGPALAFPSYPYTSYRNHASNKIGSTTLYTNNPPFFANSLGDNSYVISSIRSNRQTKPPLVYSQMVESRQMRGFASDDKKEGFNKNRESYGTQKSHSTFSNSHIKVNEFDQSNRMSPLSINDLKKG